MRIKLSNSFHQTTCTLLVKETTWDKRWILSPQQVKRAKHKLCGVEGCTCSGPLGTRGVQAPPMSLYYPEEYEDGSVGLLSWLDDSNSAYL